MTFSGYKPSTLILWAVLALPALAMIPALAGTDPQAFHRLLHPTGEWAARFMIAGMMASGLMLLFKGGPGRAGWCTIAGISRWRPLSMPRCTRRST